LGQKVYLLINLQFYGRENCDASSISTRKVESNVIPTWKFENKSDNGEQPFSPQNILWMEVIIIHQNPAFFFEKRGSKCSWDMVAIQKKIYQKMFENRMA
jgi:hypothetical protein